MTTRTRKRISRRTVVLLTATLVCLAGLAFAANPIVTAVAGRSIGTLIAEQNGRLQFDRYATAKDVPAASAPSWLPSTATSVTVVQPGPKSGLTGDIRIDADVPHEAPAPDACVPSASWSMPFNAPDDWPTFTVEDLQTCDQWTLAIHDHHWYAWSANDPQGKNVDN